VKGPACGEHDLESVSARIGAELQLPFKACVPSPNADLRVLRIASIDQRTEDGFGASAKIVFFGPPLLRSRLCCAWRRRPRRRRGNGPATAAVKQGRRSRRPEKQIQPLMLLAFCSLRPAAGPDVPPASAHE